MSNASLKEQLEAVASELSEKLGIEKKPNLSSKPVHAKNIRNTTPLRSTPKPIEKKIKPKWLDYAQYGIELLKVYFPSSFKSPRDIKPLKKGIKQDLVKRLSEISTIATDDKACMVKSLAFYVNTAVYHKTVVEGAIRIDLDGKEAGKVSAEEAAYSLERYNFKLQAKKLKNSQTEEKNK